MRENIVNYLFIVAVTCFFQILVVIILNLSKFDNKKHTVILICINYLLIAFYLCLVRYMPIYAIFLMIFGISTMCFLCKSLNSSQAKSNNKIFNIFQRKNV